MRERVLGTAQQEFDIATGYWRQVKRRNEQIEELLDVAKAWERWEAKLILEDKANALEFMSTELYEEMLSLQAQRNEATAKADSSNRVESSKP